MRVALFRTPAADVGAELADLLGKRAVAGDCIGTEPADRGALDAAGRTVIFTFLANHVRETAAALGRTVITRIDTRFSKLIQGVIHGVSFG